MWTGLQIYCAVTGILFALWAIIFAAAVVADWYEDSYDA